MDFYCKSLGLVIEIDGSSHADNEEYDENRDAFLEGYGLKVVHIFDTDVKNNLNGVMSYLEQIVKGRKSELE